MAIYVGSTEIAAPNVGGVEAKAVYVGSTLVWEPPAVIEDRGFAAGSSSNLRPIVQELSNTYGSDNYYFQGRGSTGNYTGTGTQIPSGAAIGVLYRTFPSTDAALDKLAISGFASSTAAQTACDHLNALPVQSIVVNGNELKSYKTSIWIPSSSSEGHHYAICNAPNALANSGSFQFDNWGRCWHRGTP